MLPIAIVRVSEFAGMQPPFAVTVVAAFIFNLSGERVLKLVCIPI
jgi:hypothetical protein